MAGINYGRVMIAGLAAGVVANICDGVVNSVLMAADFERMARRLNLDLNAINSSQVMATWIGVDFVYGILIVWTYAAMRPRLGAGPSTALAAGGVLFLAVTAVLFGFVGMGIFTPDTFLKGTLYSALTTAVASLAGGYLYKE